MTLDTENFRLDEFMRIKKVSRTALAEQLGSSQPTISAILSGKRSLSRGMIARIGDLYPDLNTKWLLTGEGDMIRKEFRNEVEDLTPDERAQLDKEIAEGRVTLVPLVHIDSVGGVHSPNAIVSSEQYVERMIPFLDARPGDVAILQSGNSMAPTIPAGAVMQIRRVDNWREYFGYGGDFVLWLADDRRITKQVLKSEDDPKNYVLCHSYNPVAADEELPKSMIKEVWKVVNVLINKGW